MQHKEFDAENKIVGKKCDKNTEGCQLKLLNTLNKLCSKLAEVRSH